MKLLFYMNILTKGGAERVVSQLIERFSGAGDSVVLVTSYPEEGEYPLPPDVKRIYLEPRKVMRSRISRNWHRVSRLRTVCMEEQPDLAIAFMREPSARLLLATRGLGVKTLVSVRNDPSHEYPGFFGRLVGRLLLPFADGCVFQTESAKEWFPKRLRAKSRIIPNAVSETFFSSEWVGGGDLISVGRLVEQKDQKLLIRAFSKVSPLFPGVRLRIVGEGELRHALESLVSDLGLEGTVLLPGETEDIPSVLRNAAAFVMSSKYEGLPNALMEAMAVGVPCVSTDCPCGGPSSLVEDGVSGLLVPVGDVDALASALAKILGDRALAVSLGDAARKRALVRLRPDSVFSEWDEYAGLIAGVRA